MINSGPRRFNYRAGLNHTGSDGRIGHCHGRFFGIRTARYWSTSLVEKKALTGPVSIEARFPAVPVAELLDS